VSVFPFFGMVARWGRCDEARQHSPVCAILLPDKTAPSMPARLKVTLLWSALCITACAVVGCQSSTQNVSQDQASRASSHQPSATGSGHDLEQDEAAGGHTLKKHVGRTDDQLRERLRRERNISAASTYTDRDTAERAVGIALEQSQAKITRWLNREGGHPHLLIDYDGDTAHPIGRTLRRGDDQTQPCSHAVIVLKWDGENSYHVLTTYPECR
jgi:hypothetical protein